MDTDTHHRASPELWVGLAVVFFAGDPTVGKDVGPFRERSRINSLASNPWVDVERPRVKVSLTFRAGGIC